MSGSADLEINRHIRRIFVRHWIDLGRLVVRTTSGRVSISGMLQRISGQGSELTLPVVEAMFHEIRHIKDVVRVHGELANWVNNGSGWMPVASADQAARSATGSASQTEKVYEIRDPSASQPRNPTTDTSGESGNEP